MVRLTKLFDNIRLMCLDALLVDTKSSVGRSTDDPAVPNKLICTKTTFLGRTVPTDKLQPHLRSSGTSPAERIRARDKSAAWINSSRGVAPVEAAS